MKLYLDYVQSIIDMPKPTNKTELQNFLDIILIIYTPGIGYICPSITLKALENKIVSAPVLG